MSYTANSLSYLNPSFWAKEAQRSLFVDNKAMAIANTTLRNLVAGEGATVYRTIVSYPASATYVPGTDITNTSVTSSSETLTISTWIASMVHVDDTEQRQSIIKLGTNISNKMMRDHNNRIEQAILAEVSNAGHSIDDGNVGGTAGNNAVVNTNTVPMFFIAADTKLDAADAPKAGRTAVVGGHFLGQLKLQQAARATTFGDGVNTRGVVANMFGWDILYSNNLPYSAVLTIATNPTAADTVTIAGVKFTFKAALAAAGDLHICDSAAETVANMVVALNAPATSITEAGSGGYTALSSDNVFILRDKRRISAVATSATVTTISGYGDIVVSETLSAVADVWSAQKQTSLFCVKGCIDMIVQIPPKIEVTRDQNQFADIVKSLLGYGKKTYADGAREMVSVAIDASTSDWK
jgi:hypothetical protein